MLLDAVDRLVNPTSNGKLTKVKLYKGLLYSTTRVQEGKIYHAKNRTEQDHLLIIEHPYRPEFILVKATYEDAAKKTKEIKPSERARDVYRFEVNAPAGQTITTEVLEERDVVSTVEINNTNDDTIRYFLSQAVSSPKVKEALQKAIARSLAWSSVTPLSCFSTWANSSFVVEGFFFNAMAFCNPSLTF